MKSKNHLHRSVKEFAQKVELTLSADFTIQEALDYIRFHGLADRIIYFYVLDEAGRLNGVIGTRALLLHPLDTRIREIMQSKVTCLHEEQTLQEAMEILQAHQFLALPVVDDERHLLGMIDVNLYFEERVEIATARRRFDIFQMIGIYVEEGRLSTPFHRYLHRMPWIFCNMFGGILCAIISKLYADVLSTALILAMFIPLVLTLSESISMQSMTQSLQWLHHSEQRLAPFIQRFFRELESLFLIAVTSGGIIGGLSLLWQGGILPGLAIGLGIFISVTITASVGFLIPLVLHLRAWDPKVAGGPVVLMFADVLTTAIYLGLATLIIL